MSGVCTGCNQVKELTIHGDCFKCHIRGLGISTKRGCKDCSSEEMFKHRTKQNITVDRTTTPTT